MKEPYYTGQDLLRNKIHLDEATLPLDIERRSFEIIDAETPLPRPYDKLLWEVARRCIHAAGDLAILPNLILSEDALQSGLAAMRRKCVIYTDTRMLAAGLVERRMRPLGIKVMPLMEIPGLENIAAKEGITRSRAGIKMLAGQVSGQIVAIGNAPTALLALLEELRSGDCDPALVVGMPVGFVNAAQSKAMLEQSGLRYFTLRGRKGGSAIAAACINAMAEMLLR